MSPETVQKQLHEGIEHHRLGRLQQAEAAYRAVLQENPDQPDALNLLGVIAMQVGQVQLGAQLLLKSVQLAPSFGSLNNLGEAFRHLGRFDDAIAAYTKSIELNPQHGDAYANLGLATLQGGKIDDAVAALTRAVQLVPNRADVHDRLGAAYLKQGDPFRAISSHQKAIELMPSFAPAHANLGVALSKTGRAGAIEEALVACNKAIELAPQAADAYGSLAMVFDRADRLADAEKSFEKAISLNPKHADYYGQRSVCLDRLNRQEDAIATLREGIRNCPNDPRLHSNLSGLLRRTLRFGGAVESADTAIKIAPAYSDAHGHRALALLADGDYLKGFHEYEWRWRCENFTTAPRDFKRPMWDGSDPAGRTILVHTEQGYGDTLQFARYIPMLAQRGATVIVECHHALRKLISRVEGVSRVIPNGLALPDFDLHLPLLSLPRAFATTLETIPRNVPYLSADPERVDAWKKRVSQTDAKMRVGLIWAGNAMPDAKRTVPADLLKQLAGIDGVQFFSLQKRSADTFSPAPRELKLIDLDTELTDFHETAAAMSALDLIVTIDSAPAHLAGALGCKTWTLIPFSPDWRWLLDREDSPWYPTMRLFRQTKANEWVDVVERVREELAARKSPKDFL